MKHWHVFLLTGCLLASGCLEGTDQIPGPGPRPVAESPSRSAEVFGRQYSAGLSLLCQDVAQRCRQGQFETLVDVNEYWVAQRTAAHEKTLDPLRDAMTAALKDEGDSPRPGTDAAALFDQLADGFAKGAK
ncbi:MAG: hypothetical protein ACKO0Z_18230 [Betaproteobacteria bacterium]